MHTKRIRYTAGSVLAATVAMTGSAGPMAQAAPEPTVPVISAVTPALSAEIDPSETVLYPQALADMAQHAVDAGMAGAAGALAGRAVGFKKKASSGNAVDAPQDAQDSHFDAPTA